MTNIDANHVSATASNFKGQISLNIANLMEWFMIKTRMKDASSAICAIQLHSTYVTSFLSVFFGVQIFFKARLRVWTIHGIQKI